MLGASLVIMAGQTVGNSRRVVIKFPNARAVSRILVTDRAVKANEVL
jgi:hypothetical protein